MVGPATRKPPRQKRAAAESKRRRRVDTDFLPAALEVLETPPSPVGRSVLWVIILAALSSLLWACLAQVDVVAVAEGRIIPRARLQSAEAAEAGVVREIYVREGQRVAAGEPLVALDPTYAGADASSAKTEYATAVLARARAEALLTRVAGKAAVFTPPPGVDPAAAAAEGEAVRARVAALDESVGALDNRINGARAQIAGLEAEKAKAAETLPLVQSQLDGRRRLLEKGLAPRTQVLALEERVVTLTRDTEVRAAEIRQTEAEIAMLRRERAKALEDFRAQAAAEKAEAEAIVATRAEGVRKAALREGYQVLVAPVAGIINEVSVTTIGDVVEAGASLVTLVPAGEELIVEALVLNRDAGFVREGQQVIVKLEAFPFTRHGFVEGVVESISPDATADDARGLVFPARIRLTKSSLREVGGALFDQRRNAIETVVREKAVGRRDGDEAREARAKDALAAVLSPGMAAQAEIITGRRRVVDFVLSPIARASREAGRER